MRFYTFLATIVLLRTTSVVSQEPYSEQLAVNLTMIAGSTYCNIESIIKNFDSTIPDPGVQNVGKNIRGMNYEYFDHIHLYTDPFNNELKMITYVNHNKNHFVFAFEGTHGKSQLLEILTDTGNIPYDLHRVPNGLVHKYFLERYKNVFRSKFLGILKNVRQKYPQYQIIYTGHSLGGAFATLAALDGVLMRITSSNILLYTFGQPRTGNYEFRELVGQNIPNIYRVVHNRDIVVHLPPCSPIFGCLNKLGGQAFYHANTEVWYSTNDMTRGNYKVCRDESKECANSVKLFEVSKEDHLYYFGIRISCQQSSVFQTLEEEDEDFMIIDYDFFTPEQLMSY